MKRKNIIIVTLCFLISIVTCSFGTSVSMYFDENDKAAYYSVEFENLAFVEDVQANRIITSELVYSDSTKNSFVVNVTIPRNDKWEQNYDHSDSYIAPTSNECNVSLSNNNFNNNNNISTDKINLRVTCNSIKSDIKNGTENLNFNLVLKGQYDSSPRYDYVNTNIDLDVSYAYFLTRIPPDLIETLDDGVRVHKDYSENFNTEFESRILSLSRFSSLSQDEKDMISLYINRNGLFSKASDFYDSRSYFNAFTFEIDSVDNDYYLIKPKSNNIFESYVKTHYYSGLPNKKFYFLDSTMDVENINNLFLEYVRMYLFDSNSLEYTTIKSYIDDYTDDYISILDLAYPNGVINSLRYNDGILTVLRSFDEDSFVITPYTPSPNTASKVTPSSIFMRFGISIDSNKAIDIRDSLSNNSNFANNFNSLESLSLVSNNYYFVNLTDILGEGQGYKIIRTYPSILDPNRGAEAYTFDWNLYTLYKGFTYSLDFTEISVTDKYTYLYNLLSEVEGSGMYGPSTGLKDSSGNNVLSSSSFIPDSGNNVKVVDTNIGVVKVDITDGKFVVTIDFDSGISMGSLGIDEDELDEDNLLEEDEAEPDNGIIDDNENQVIDGEIIVDDEDGTIDDSDGQVVDEDGNQDDQSNPVIDLDQNDIINENNNDGDVLDDDNLNPETECIDGEGQDCDESEETDPDKKDVVNEDDQETDGETESPDDFENAEDEVDLDGGTDVQSENQNDVSEVFETNNEPDPGGSLN